MAVLPDVGKLDALGALFTLLPGLLTYFTVHALTKRERKLVTVEVVLHGLAYTLLVHAVWAGLTLWSWIPTPNIVGLSFTAVGVGLVLAKVNNSGWVYNILRHLGLTEESPWSNMWASAFRYARREVGEYVVLHLEDGRRMMGAVRGYSAEQSPGHVVLEQAQWLSDTDSVTEFIGLIVVPGELIRFLQFLPKIEESENE